jgi:hypothetical protein
MKNFDLGYDLSVPIVGYNLAPVKSAEHVRLYEWHRKQERVQDTKAYILREKHLKQIQALTDTLCDYAYNGGGHISEFKKARDKLWREQHKFENAVRVSNGRKPRPFDRSDYNLDFE